ncbi:hypothetical protein R3I93_012285 [Phoxinus phoxinus]|uniref:Sterile alpha motif domain-containing protein 9-like n=1 Tax=Phoxinus phoxinus TaxID=58324 RepID=A0AAN9CWA2_9TELE
MPTNLRDSLSCLDVVWSDMFETGDSAIDSMKHETDYLKGAPPQWLNFSTPENSPFVERDCFQELIKLIEGKKRKRCLITEVSLPYQPGSGGSTLAMQVLWRFHKDLRCAKVIESYLEDKKLPKQVVDLFLLSNEQQHAEHDQKTVLLLLDTKENIDQPIKNSLWENLIDEIRKRDISTDTPAVIILNCRTTTVRATGKVEITMRLSPNEKERFDQKKKELKKKYKTVSENFHAFNIMQGGFQKEDAEKLITAKMVKHVKSYPKSKSTRLLSFLALINSYVPGSHLSRLLCEEFMAETKRSSDEGNGPLEAIMKPFINLIVIFSEGKPKTDCIRMAHPLIADACVRMLTDNHLTRFNITSDFLQNMVTGKESDYMRICKKMLTARVDTEKYKFSKLILHLIMKHEECIRLLKQGSDLFTTDPFYPQALARFYYLEGSTNKYEWAESWAKKAIARAPTKSHIMDTLGQVHKSHLRTILNTNAYANTETVLDIANSAVKAFQEEENAAEHESEDTSSFNNRGYFGFLQVCKYIHDFSAKNPLEQQYCTLISKHRSDVEERYDFFEWYLGFSRLRINKLDPDYLHDEIEECYKRYFARDGLTDEDTLNEKKMKSFAGLLHFPKSDISALKRNPSALQNPQSDDETQNILYVSANIILSVFDEECEPIEELQASLQRLWVSKEKDRDPEFYLLILLLFWFDDEAQPRITNPPDLEKCVLYMRDSYEKNYQIYLRGRYLVPLFFFGEGNGLQRLVHSSKLQRKVEGGAVHPDDSPDWLELLFKFEVDCLQRISGVVKRNQKVFAIRDGKQIEVTPHKPESVYKQGQVSFYLGFNIRGPVAFNIRYMY